MGLRTGIVTRLLRDQETEIGDKVTLIDAIIDDDPIDTLAILVGDEPAPLSHALFDDDLYPSWVCHGPRGGVEEVVREHFVAGGFLAAGTGVTTGSFQEAWVAALDGAGSSIIAPTDIGGDDAQGYAVLTSGATSGRYAMLRKQEGITPLTDGKMTWIRARFQMPTSLTNSRLELGLADGDSFGSAYAAVVFTATDLQLNLSGASATVTGTTPAAGQWFVADLVVSQDEFGALWIDGDGPYFGTVGVPNNADELNLGARQQTTGGAANKESWLDYVRMDLVNAFESPTALGL